MDNDSVSKCLEYIGDQIKAYVVNRLANAPCTTAQLVGTFSMIVDHLSISENSLVYVLDALYKEKVIDFTMVNNNTRLYSLKDFNKDYIFELNLEKVEKFIAEDKIPYFSDHRKNVDAPLYFEARKNRTCIYINTPLTVREHVENSVPEITVDNPVIVEAEVLTSDFANDDLNMLQNIKDLTESDEILYTETTTNYEIFEDNLDENENVETTESETSNTNDLAASDDSTDAIFENNNSVDLTKDTYENNYSFELQSEQNMVDESPETLESDKEVIACEEQVESSNSDNEFYSEPTKKSDFDSIDFSSIDTFVTSSDQQKNTYSSNDSMDLFEQHFADALAKAMAQTTQNITEETCGESESTILNNDSNIAVEDTQHSTTENNSENFVEESKQEFIEKDKSFLSEAQNQTNDSQTIADDIVFTELKIDNVSTVNPEEERERQERALRMMEEILEAKSSSESTKGDTAGETISEKVDDVEQVSTEPVIVKKKVEKDKLTLYISEQERINNYDWHNRLQRALVDVVEDNTEDNKKEEELTLTSTYSELKALMASKNYVFKAYPSHESKSFYTENYVFTNRLARSTSIYTYVFMLIELLISYFFVDPFIKKGFPFYLIIGVVLAIIPIFFTLKYILFRDKRKPANFVFRLSLVTALMIYINLMVMVVLVAFFVPALEVDVNNLKSMILTIFYPAALFLNIPVSVCIYAILYRSKRYHLH